MIPGADNKGLCSACHKFYHPETGERVRELEHITVTHVEEKERCKPCTEDREAWRG